MEANKFLLDSCICIEHLRGKKDIWPFINERGIENCYLSEIVVAELKIGEILISKNGGTKFGQHLSDFLSKFQILPISPIIDTFAHEKCRLQFQGTPLSNNFDLLIGCTALFHQMTLVTDNYKDFKNIEGLKLENWVIR